MHVCRHPTPSFGVRLIWRLCDQFPSDPPWSEPCWACITTISLSHSVKTRGTVAGVQPSPFYLPTFPSNGATRLNKTTAGMPGKVCRTAFPIWIVFLPYRSAFIQATHCNEIIIALLSLPTVHLLLSDFQYMSLLLCHCFICQLQINMESVDQFHTVKSLRTSHAVIKHSSWHFGRFLTTLMTYCKLISLL